ncbi:MAG TPA: biopolymer transporter ExbD [Caldithrix abyssi]|uniref:Biopolymer transporter ExbD n=1 Tax=Caldithrix abyssi TaxID=187145 RepID=A0A7V1PVV8_CALAY|nr:biopolymer transporter ExbD [Caldithrix abyssi]
MQLSSQKSKKLTLNLTSLIDVLFILIIFFSVTSTFLEQPGIDLKLPEAETSEAFTSQKVIVYIDKEKNLFLNDNLISINELAKEIKQLNSYKKDKSIVLKADEKADYGRVIEVMDKLRKNGVYKIIVSTSMPAQ